MYFHPGLWPAVLAATVDAALFDQSNQAVLGGFEGAQGMQQPPKNVVFILSDDQDAAMDSISYMPLLRKHLAEQGTTYRNHFTTTAICCPSRVSLWTGKQPHNTNVTDVNPPYGILQHHNSFSVLFSHSPPLSAPEFTVADTSPQGGYPKFIAQGLNSNYLPVWLHEEGYNTYYTGKLFNSHTTSNYDSPFPAGWTSTDFLLDPGTYSYLNPIYQRNKEAPVHHKNEHTSDLIIEKSQRLLDDAITAGKPFFLGVAPIAPHSDVSVDRHVGLPMMTEPVPAERHKDLFKGVKVPRTENFNPDTPSGASWVRKLPQHNASSVEYLDHYYRQRLRALQAVDELVEKLIIQLEEAGILDDTYIIYSSDNGFHIGQHRLPPGKECGYDEDIRVPLVVRGPGVPKGKVEDAVTTHIDLAPTILHIANAEARPDFDGAPIPLGLGSSSTTTNDSTGQVLKAKRHEHVAVEYWGFALAEGEGGGFDGQGHLVVLNNTYKAVRIIGHGYNLYYSVWCNNEHELYNLETDPGQLHNLYPFRKSSSIHAELLGVKLDLVIHRLDALMMVLKSCTGATCIEPWEVLHPKGDVTSLYDALNAQFDVFYEEQVKVAFNRCELGYIIDAEGPQAPYQYREGTSWHAWV